jgi:hypothetical protein
LLSAHFSKTLKQSAALFRAHKVEGLGAAGDWRVLPRRYLTDRYRRVVNVLFASSSSGAIVSEQQPMNSTNLTTTAAATTTADDQKKTTSTAAVVFTLRIACGELDDRANDAINALADSQHDFMVFFF